MRGGTVLHKVHLAPAARWRLIGTESVGGLHGNDGTWGGAVQSLAMVYHQPRRRLYRVSAQAPIALARVEETAA